MELCPRINISESPQERGISFMLEDPTYLPDGNWTEPQIENGPGYVGRLACQLLEIDGEERWSLDIDITHENQHQGYGKQLLKAFVDYVKEDESRTQQIYGLIAHRQTWEYMQKEHSEYFDHALCSDAYTIETPEILQHIPIVHVLQSPGITIDRLVICRGEEFQSLQPEAYPQAREKYGVPSIFTLQLFGHIT